MKALDELQKRSKEEDVTLGKAIEEREDEREKEALSTKLEILEEIEKFNKMSENSDFLKLHNAYNAIATTKDGFLVSKSPYSTTEFERHPSLAMILENGRLDEKSWQTIVKEGYLPKNYLNWYNFLLDDRNLAIQLVQAVRNAKNRVDQNEKANKEIKTRRNKKIIAALCVPATFLFLILIFVSRSVPVVWGTIILGAIILEAAMIPSTSYGIGNKIAQLVCAPIMGAVGGAVVGVVCWIFSAYWAFMTVLWIVALVIVNLIAIFIASDA
jgi:hypothetical protein